MKVSAKLVTAGALATITVGGGAAGLAAAADSGARSAGPAGRVAAGSAANPCEPMPVYRIASKRVHSAWVPGTNLVDGPGGTMRVSVKRSHTIEMSINASVSIEAGVFFATAKAEVGVGLAKKNTVEVGHTFVKKIKKGRYGHARYRVISYKITFQKVREAWNGRTCIDKFLGGGTAIVPTSKEGWRYWETRRP